MEEAAAAGASDPAWDREHVDFSPRCYQQELFEKARQGNIIICLETGSGKTLIAAMLLKSLVFTFSSSTPYVAIFLVPTVMLVEQQARAIQSFTGLKIGQYSGQHDNVSWDPAKWASDVYALEILVMTPQILLNVLQHAMLTFDSIKALVFDECHHCQKNHPYALIMEEFYSKIEVCKRPRILGMTASPVIRKGKSEIECIRDICSLERMLDAKVVTVKERSELDSIIPFPNIQIKEYDKVYHSLEGLESVMKNINTLKAKDIYHMDHEGIDGNRNEQEGLERICRDLEYCLYNLGLWFARHVVSAGVQMLKESDKKMHNSSIKGKKDSFVRDLYEYLNQTILQGPYEEDSRLINLKPDLVSNKVSSLVDVLLNFRNLKVKCIVFVERVVAAKCLADFLSNAVNPLRCKHLVGSPAREGRPSRKQMLETIKDFRSGLVDLVVATDVAEEGLDIQDCFLIVRFDFPKTLRSFIQSRGRARVQASSYVILKDRMDIFQEELLDKFICNEKFVAQKILQRDNSFTDMKWRAEGDVYEVKTTGAIVSSHSSIQLLNYYCSTLPSDEFCNPQPLFTYVVEQYGVKCCIVLPHHACFRRVDGDVCETKAAAKRVACLKACKILHAKGDLTDYLLPKCASIDGGAATLLHQHNDKAETEYLQEPVIPVVWSGRPSVTSGLVCLHMYIIDFSAMQGQRRQYSNFALVMKSPLPLKGANFSRVFHLREGQAVFCKLKAIKDICLDSLQVAHAEQFQRRLFSFLLDRSSYQPLLKEESTADSSWYLLVPIKKCQQHNHTQDPEIDWERIMNLKSFVGSENIVNAPESPLLKTKNTLFQFSNGIVSIENVPGLLLRTLDSTRLYCVIGIFENLNADSPFPDNGYETYTDYFKIKYGRTLSVKGQALLKARFLREVYNTSLRRPTKGDESTDVPERSIVELPPEICRIEYLGFYDDLVNAAVILPSLMQRLEDVLVATQFQERLSSQFSEGSVLSVEKVLEAITTERCLEGNSLERLELLGDSFLKYAISCNLFLLDEEASEGHLTTQRKENICNRMLFTLGKKIGLIEYIRDEDFFPKNWVAPCHPSKVCCNENNIRELHGESSKHADLTAFVICNKRHRWIQWKTVADAVEALIGACLEDGGEHSAFAFVNFIGLKVDISNEQVAKVQMSSQNNLSLIERVDVKVVEEILNYIFKYKGLLIEALTHASFSSHLGKCYQRLEFLGDSVLELLITQHLYRDFRDAKPGDLTDLRSTIVSNENFAKIVVEKKLYLHLVENATSLSHCIKGFLSHEITGGWEGEKCPKVLGDILESLGGAILVDSGFDLSLVWEVFEPMLKPLISAGKIQLHPVRELKEICQKKQLTCEESLVKIDEKIQFSFKMYIGEEVLCGISTSKDKKSAKRQAAVDALAKLQDLGYVHAIRCKALSSPKMSNIESSLSETIRAKVEIAETRRDNNNICKASDQSYSIPHLWDTQKTAHPISSEDSVNTPYGTATLNAVGCPWTYTTQDSVESGELVSDAHQLMNSTEMPCPDSRFVNDFSSFNVGPSSSLGESLPRAELHEACQRNAYLSIKSSEISCPDTFFENCFSSPDVSFTKGQGRPRAELYEACTRKGWKDASFICANEEGPPHNKWYTYQVVLQLPAVGEVQCTGDPRRTAKQAMDSAATELLTWLISSGYL